MARTLQVSIVGDASSYERSLKRAARETQKFGKSIEGSHRSMGRSRSAFGGLTKGVLGLAGGFVGVGGLAAVTRAAFSEMADSQKVAAQTAAALKSTGNAAGVTAKQVDALANSMLKKTGIDDEATKTAENMLLTFTNIRNEVGKTNGIFDQATRSTADLATRMNQGAIPSAEQMQTASLQLGKALNDPIKGISSLRRVGVQFTDQQKAQIKQLVKSGHTMDAQKVILRELRKEFGGSAEAAGKTFTGQLRILTETLNNLAGDLASKLMPAIQKYLEMAVKWLSNSKNQKKIIDAVTSAGRALKGGLDTLIGAFRTLSKFVGGNENAIKALVAAYATFKAVQIAASVSKLAGSFVTLSKGMKTTAGSTKGLSKSLAGKAGLVGAAGVASFELTTLALKVTGLDKKLHSAGGAAFDFAAKLGLIHDPMAQFEGTRIVGQGGSKFLIGQARRLERGGMSSAQAAREIVRTHPNVAKHDAEVFANAAFAQLARRVKTAGGGGRRLQAAGAGRQLAVAGAGGPMIHIEHFHSHATNVPQLENELVRRAKQRPHSRRGP